MKYPIYSYRDNKVGFLSPFVDQNEDAAIRGFSYAINNKEGIMSFAASDFDLYRIGFFDSEKGMIESYIPVLIVSGSSVAGGK